MEQFQDAAASAKTLSGLNGKQKMQMYGLFKQAQAGPCDTPEPSDTVGKYLLRKSRNRIAQLDPTLGLIFPIYSPE